MIVCKFGGTSVADAAGISRLVRIVEARLDDRPLVVVSALAGVTDALLALARAAYAGDAGAVRDALDALTRRHASVARQLPGGEAALGPIQDDLEELGGEVESIFRRMSRPAELVPSPAGASCGARGS